FVAGGAGGAVVAAAWVTGVFAITAAASASVWALIWVTIAATWVMSVAAATRAESPWMRVMMELSTVVSRATAAVRSSMTVMVFFPSVLRSERRVRTLSTFASILPTALNMRVTLRRRGSRPHALPGDLQHHPQCRAVLPRRVR